MKIAFYCPLKPLSHPTPSGDRQIARGLFGFLSSKAQVIVLSEFRTKFFYRSPAGVIKFIYSLAVAYLLVKRQQPDIFITYHLYYKAPDPIGFLLAWWFRKPYFIFEGMYARKARRMGLWAGFFLTHWALSYAEKIFSDKSEDHLYLEEWFPGKSVYLPPSIDLSVYDPDPLERQAEREKLRLEEGEVAIITVAMLRPDRKTEGVEFLLRCLGRLKREGIRFRWIHVGGGACERSVSRLCQEELGASGTMLGLLDYDQVAAVLKAGDIFAFPGLDEGFGLVYVEAQAAGLPVVAFNNGGIPDAVWEGESAFLTKVLDEAEYEDAIRRLVLNPDLRKKMGTQGFGFAREKFDRQRNYELLWRSVSSVH